MVFPASTLMPSFLNLQCVVIATTLLLAILTWLRRRPINLPPGPRGWPILGNLLSFRKGQFHLVMADWAVKYGSIVSFWIGPRRAIVLNDMAAVKEAFVKQADNFMERFMVKAAFVNFPQQGSFIYDGGEAWKQLRRFGMTAMRSLSGRKNGSQNHINAELLYLIESFASKEGKPFNPEPTIRNAASNIICTISFGSRFEYSDPRFGKLLEFVKNLFSTGSLYTLIQQVFPSVMQSSKHKARFRMFLEIRTFIDRIIQEHRETFDENDPRDFIDMYLMECKQRSENGGNSNDVESAICDKTVWRGIFDLFLAGTDTTTNTLMWMLLLMCVYPTIQQKVQEEIKHVIGYDRQPTLKDRNKMPYTNAVLLESQRFVPVVPSGVPYKTTCDTELMGHTIPAETMVIVNIWAVMHDPKSWKDPEKYDPTRFLSKDGKTVERPETFIPFGFGRRICLGKSLAEVEIFLFFVNVLQRFSFSLPAGRPQPSFVGVCGITYGPQPFEIVATKR